VIVLIYAIAGMLVGGLALGILGTLAGVLYDKYMEWKTGEPYYTRCLDGNSTPPKESQPC